MNNKFMIMSSFCLLLLKSAIGMSSKCNKIEKKIMVSKCSFQISNFGTLPKNGLSDPHIVNYKPEYLEPIKKMTIPNIPLLATVYSFKETELQAVFEEDIKTALEQFGKVYLIDGNPAGYINYDIYKPFYANMVFKNAKVATIYHLLIDENYRNQKIGSKLMEHALGDCKDNGAHKVTLKITLDGQIKNCDKFYHNFGFELGRTASIHAGGTQEYFLNLDQSPFKKRSKELFSKMKNLF